MKVFNVRGANIVVGNRRYTFAPLISLDVPDATAEYLLSTRQFYREGEIPEESKKVEERQLRIGVFRTGGFGDALLGSCVIEALHRKYPKAQITGHAYSTVQNIWMGHPRLHHIDSGYHPRLNNAPHNVSGYDAFFDLMPDCHVHYRPNSVSPETILRHKAARAEIDQYKHLPAVRNHLKPFCDAKGFEALDVYNFLYGTDAKITDMYIPQKASDRQIFEKLQTQKIPLLPDQYITIHDWAFNGRQTKSWFPAYWKTFNEYLRKEYGLPIVQIGGSVEEHLFGDHDLRGKTTFGESAELVKHALFHVDNESTPAHIAAAVGTPCVCFCGSTLKYWRHRENFNIVSNYKCQECEGAPNWYKVCSDNGTFGCMTSLTPDYVIDCITKSDYLKEKTKRGQIYATHSA